MIFYQCNKNVAKNYNHVAKLGAEMKKNQGAEKFAKDDVKAALFVFGL